MRSYETNFNFKLVLGFSTRGIGGTHVPGFPTRGIGIANVEG